MNAMRLSDAGALPGGRVNLNIEQLKRLRLGLGMSQEALSESCANQRLSLSLASIKRAESGKPVLYRTARQLSSFFGVPLLGLVQGCGAAMPARHAYERMQCRAALDAAQTSGHGRLIELHGQAGAGKSRLLASCADEARERGYHCIELRARGAGASADQLLPGLASALLGMASALACGAQLEAQIAQRLGALGLPAWHGPACVAMLIGARGHCVGDDSAAQALALDALIRRAARDRPLMIGIDDMHLGDSAFAAMLAQVLPACLACPVSWILAYASGCQVAFPSVNEKLATVARTVFHLAAPQGPMTPVHIPHAWPGQASDARRPASAP